MSILFEIKTRLSNPSKIIPLFGLYIKRFFNISFEKGTEKIAPKIDIVIPTISKDFSLIDDVIKSLSKINHEINKIYIVAPVKPEIIEYCNKNNLNFIDEKTVLGYGKDVIDYKVNGTDRSGWIFQQLLKLSCEDIVEMDNYFILDSDTLIVDNFSLIKNDKFIFYQNTEWHEPYFRTFKKIFGYVSKNSLSFTSHMMIFNREMLKSMKKELETKYNKSWDKVYLSTIDTNESSCVSDYDNYANWVLCNYQDKVIQAPLYNTAFNRDRLDEIKKNISKYAKNYKTISFHSWIK